MQLKNEGERSFVRKEDLLSIGDQIIHAGKLYISGGIAKRGWSTHDMDLVIEKSLNEALRLFFYKRFNIEVNLRTFNPRPPLIEIGDVYILIINKKGDLYD